MDRPTTREDLWLFIYQHCGLRLPHKSFAPGHSTPFDFVADAFFNPGQDLAAWANRSGLKTLCSSIIAALEFRFCESKLHGRVLSGSEDQAKNLYEYWQNWCWGLLADRLKADPQKLLTRLDNGELRILAASQKRVRGAKVQRLFRDEIDEIDPEIYGASVGMLASLDGVPARTVDTSTWHNPAGPMGRLVQEAPQRGIRLHKWNVWESLAQCPTERHQEGRNCEKCPLGEVCLAKARELNRSARMGIASECCGLFGIDDAIKQIRQWSQQQWEAEAECKRPSLEGLVYPKFDRAVHVKADLDFSDDLPTFRAIDWGLRDFVCLWVQQGKNGNLLVVDEYWAQDALLADNARAILDKDKDWPVHSSFCDPAGRNRNDQTGYSAIDTFRSLGLPCMYATDAWSVEVRNGINLIRAALRPAAGPPRLFIAPACKQLINAFEGYRLRKVNNEFVDEPVKPQPWDHPMDALRYFFVNAQGGPRVESRQMGYT